MIHSRLEHSDSAVTTFALGLKLISVKVSRYFFDFVKLYLLERTVMSEMDIAPPQALSGIAATGGLR